MILRVDPGSAVPVYEQLRSQLSTMAGSGALPARAPLPTIRQLAADLGIAKGTVSKAYDALVREGVIVSDGRRGTSIAVQPMLGARERERRLAEAAEQYAIAIVQLGAPMADAERALVASHTRLTESR
jgi:DNA-binding transcriptional regulator YhcF (GntR family)